MMKHVSAAALFAAAVTMSGTCYAGMDEAKKWVDSEFQPSVLSKDEQMKEMEWFVKAAAPFKGLEINVLSEDIPTHEYESNTLAKAFFEITGIKVNHQYLGEGEVVQAVQTQMQTNRNLYDGYINDSDLIGTHSRLQSAVSLTDWMAGDGKDVTNPGLDVDDFMGKSFTTGPDGKVQIQHMGERAGEAGHCPDGAVQRSHCRPVAGRCARRARRRYACRDGRG